MSDNQNNNVKNPVSFSGQGVSQVPTTESDSQMIDDVLKELEGQETEQKDINSQNIIDSLVEEVGSIGSKGQLSNDSGVDSTSPEDAGGIKKPEGNENIPTEKPAQIDGGQDSGVVKPAVAESSSVVKKETENFGGKNAQFLEPLKNAKFEYERLGQLDDEQKIIGARAIETYLHWVKESRKLLREDLSDEEKEKISIFIPKRIQEQLKSGTAPSPSVLKELNKTDFAVPAHAEQVSLSTKQPALSSTKVGKENILRERVHRIEERINNLDQNKPEYPEELLPLKTKKVLMEEEIRNNIDEDPTEVDQERLEQERSTQDVLNKLSFENKAPVARPEKEEKTRLKKAQLAEEIEKDGDGKKQGDRPKQKEQKEIHQTPNTPQGEKEDESVVEPAVAESFGTVKKEPTPVYTDEQLHSADETRKEFWKKISSITSSEWYKSPSKNRDFVNKQIIQVSGILSGKEAAEIDMDDIQTARIFMFNDAPQKVFKHPAFSYVESFYNYQSSQGCTGINPEEVFLKQKKGDSDSGPLSEKSLGSKKRISFVEQVSVKKPSDLNTDSKEPPEEIKESDLLGNALLD